MPDPHKSSAPSKKARPTRKGDDIKARREDAGRGKDRRLDEGLEETFPASDSVSTHNIT
jgi:hypothetical protein